jgi:hypothetical protein
MNIFPGGGERIRRRAIVIASNNETISWKLQI